MLHEIKGDRRPCMWLDTRNVLTSYMRQTSNPSLLLGVEHMTKINVDDKKRSESDDLAQNEIEKIISKICRKDHIDIEVNF